MADKNIAYVGRLSRKSFLCRTASLIEQHFQVVSQETRVLSKYYTTALVVFVWIIQILSISGIIRLGLEFLAVSTIAVNLFIGMATSSPIIILVCAVYFIYQQNLANNCLLKDDSQRMYRDTVLFKFYISLLRFNYFIIEPVATGFLLSLLPTSSLKYSLRDQIGYTGRILLVAPTIFAIVVSVIYALFIESILPNSHILSCSNNVNFLMINLAIKLGIVLDASIVLVSKRGMSKLVIFVLAMARNISSFIAIYWNTNRSFYFHPKGRTISNSLHGSFIILAMLNLVQYMWIPYAQDRYMIVPGLLFGSIMLRLIMNLNSVNKSYEIDPNNCSFDTILDVANNCYLAYKCNEDEDRMSSDGKRLRIQVQSYLKKSSPEFQNYRLQYTNCSKDAEAVSVDFAMFLFYKLIQRERRPSLKTLLYQGFYLNLLSVNLYQLAAVLMAIRQRPDRLLLSTQIACLQSLVNKTLRRVYIGQLRLNRSDSQFYGGQIAGGKSQRVSGLVTSKLRGNKYLRDDNGIDIHGSLNRESLRENMVTLMSRGVENILSMYQHLSRKRLSSMGVHEYSSMTRNTNMTVRSMFNKIEDSANLDSVKPISHLLPYALFLDTAFCDRIEMSRAIKLHRERSRLLNRQVQRGGQVMQAFQIEHMVAFSVSADPLKLGAITFSTKNMHDLAEGSSLNMKHLSEFFSDSFKPVHADLLSNFVLRQNAEYLGIQKQRFIRTNIDSHFEQVNSLVKLSPSLNSSDAIEFCCLLENVFSCTSYLLISPAGMITGYNRNLHSIFPDISRYLNKDVALFSEDLKSLIEDQMSTVQGISQAIDREVQSMPRHLNFLSGFSKRVQHQDMTEDMRNETFVSIYLNSNELGVRDNQELMVYVEPVVPCRLGNEIKMHDISVRISSGSLCALTQERDSTTQESKLVLVNSPTRNLDITIERMLPTVEKYSVSNFGYLGSQGQTLNEETIQLRKKMSSRRLKTLQTIKKSEIRPEAALISMPAKTKLVSDLNFDNSSSSVGTTKNFKHRVFRIINRQKRYLVWRELISIALVQLLIWMMAVYVTALADKNYNYEMAKAIELRKGVWLFALANAKLISSFAETFDYVFEKKGLLKPGRYRHVLPHLDRKLFEEAKLEFRQSERYSRRLLMHIYSFEASYAQRYLQYNSTYTTEMDSGLGQTFTGTYDVNHMYYMAYASLRRWHSNIDQLDLNDTNITELYEIMGVGILGGIGTKLLNTLIDTDVAVYTKLTQQTRTTVLVSIVISLVLANAIIFLVMVIRSKMVYVYSAFRRLYDYEIDQQIAYLSKILHTLRLSLIKVKEFEMQFVEYLREKKVSAPDETERRHRTATIESKRAWKSLFGDCFGLIFFITFSFCLMEAYNLTIYVQHNKISLQTSRKLELMANYRFVLSGSAAVTFTMNRMFAYVAYNRGLGLQDLDKKALPELAGSSNAFLEANYGGIDRFVQTIRNTTDSNEVGGFDILLKKDPCSFVDLKAYKLTHEECAKMADCTMGNNVITVMRWIRFTFSEAIGLIVAAKGNEKFAIINGRRFTELNVLRQIFLVPFTEAFCEQFFERISEYHGYTEELIRVTLGVYLALSIAISIAVNAAGYHYAQKQVRVSLNSFYLLPAGSTKNNPQVATILYWLN